MSRKHPGRRSVPATSGSVVLPAALTNSLRMAESFRRNRKYEEALSLLQRLKQQYPRQTVVLIELAVTLHKMDREEECEPILMELVALKPDDPDFYLPLVSAHSINGHLTMAFQTLEKFLQRWPQHPEAGTARKLVEIAGTDLRKRYTEMNLIWPDDIEAGVRHDRMQILIDNGKYREAREAGERILAEKPQFAPALNNISQTYFVEGDFRKASDYTRRVLDFAPDNVHALANLVCYSLLSGNRVEAEAFGARLKASTSPAAEREFKVIQALTFLGDDAGVLECYRKALQANDDEIDKRDEIEYLPLVHHMAAVAYLRSGQEQAARDCWKKALALQPDLDIAKQNLRDLTLPLNERNGPWPFGFMEWCVPGVLEPLQALIEKRNNRSKVGTNAGSNVGTDEKEFLQQHPDFATLIALLLEHGSPESRIMALAMSEILPSETRLTAVRDFVTGQRGPDDLRVETLHHLAHEGVWDDEPVRMWVNGEWRDIWPIRYDINDEPMFNITPAIQRQLELAGEALQSKNYPTAIRIYEEMIAKHPDLPIPVNNLAAAYNALGDTKKYHALIQQLRTQFPDYLLGTINEAQRLLSLDKLDEGRALLMPLVTRKRFHTSEFSGLAGAMVTLFSKTGEFEEAQKWVEMWEQVVPEHTNLPILRNMLMLAKQARDRSIPKVAPEPPPPSALWKPTRPGLSKRMKSKLTGNEED